MWIEGAAAPTQLSDGMNLREQLLRDVLFIKHMSCDKDDDWTSFKNLLFRTGVGPGHVFGH